MQTHEREYVRAKAEELLQAEEADAWGEYLDRTKDHPPVRYNEIEPWAWKQLKNRLKTIKARRKRLG